MASVNNPNDSDVLKALAARAEACVKAIPINETVGTRGINGVWTSDEAAMKRLLPGAIVAFF